MASDDHTPRRDGHSREGDPETDPFMGEYARRERADLVGRVERPDGAEAYGLVDGDVVDGPALPGEMVTAPDLDRLIDLVAADLVLHSVACARTFGDFHIALSGGRTPVKLYERLMYDPNCRSIPWRKTHLWLVEERRVAPTDPQSTYGLLKETIVSHSDIPAEQVHPIAVNVRDPAGDYERLLKETLGWRERGHDRLDYVLLGLGEDGSTAGLVAGSDVAAVDDRLVVSVDEDRRRPSRPARVTMTIPMFNAARFVAVLVAGENKANAIRRIVAGRESTSELPIGAVRPVGGQLKWYLDHDACGGLDDGAAAF